MLERLRVLADLGASIHLAIASYEPPVASAATELARLCAGVTWIPRTRGAFSMLGMAPFQVASRRGLRRMALPPKLDLVLLESHYVASLLAHPGLREQPAASRVVRVHNDESAYFRALARAESHPARRWFQRWEAARFAWLERWMLPRIDEWLFLSTSEHRQFAVRHPAARATLLGPPWQPTDLRMRRPVAGRVLWLGNLFMPNNRHGLDWYLAEVHPRLLERVPEYHLVIAGNARGANLGALRDRAASPTQRIALVESPELVAPLYHEAALVINPIFEGAGVKMKTINSFEHGVPLVTTTKGLEGTALAGGEHAGVADDAEGFVDHVVETMQDPTLGARRVEAGRLLLGRHANAREVLRELLQRANRPDPHDGIAPPMPRIPSL